MAIFGFGSRHVQNEDHVPSYTEELPVEHVDDFTSSESASLIDGDSYRQSRERPVFVPEDNAYGSDIQKDYSAESVPYTFSSLMREVAIPDNTLNPAQKNMALALSGGGQIDYLFKDEKPIQDKYSHKLIYNTGAVYGVGMLIHLKR